MTQVQSATSFASIEIDTLDWTKTKNPKETIVAADEELRYALLLADIPKVLTGLRVRTSS